MSLPNDRPPLVDGAESPPAGRFVLTLATLGRHPNSAIVRALEHGPLRFNEVVEALVDGREGTVGAALRELDRDGFVRRHVDAGPPLRVLYQLTALGTELAPSLRALSAWADRDRELAPSGGTQA